eukprot:CAMPEP_0182859620 /NCGR_PEP_ID=MMETSP0034_2-20130328/4412_1 /TAXON_ID=156128 /ORGANISM="Nephroselmis pyriformis, Strain CCMP717" /LENGTH=335 /DNA_ID=CAMNT_0024991271 /DNA_START=16 /DNA_END=1023 /DNA_ORIENTATION=-
MSNSELACTYAALILADDGVAVTVSARRGAAAPGALRASVLWGLLGLALRAGEGRAIAAVLSRGAAKVVLEVALGLRAPGKPAPATGVGLRILQARIWRETGPPSRQADKIETITKAAGVNVEAYWPALFAKLLETKSVEELISNVGAGALPLSTPPLAGEAQVWSGEGGLRAQHVGVGQSWAILEPGCGGRARVAGPWCRAALARGDAVAGCGAYRTAAGAGLLCRRAGAAPCSESRRVVSCTVPAGRARGGCVGAAGVTVPPMPGGEDRVQPRVKSVAQQVVASRAMRHKWSLVVWHACSVWSSWWCEVKLLNCSGADATCVCHPFPGGGGGG